MKKFVILTFFLVLAGQNALKAQEQEPLVFRVVVDWTIAGSFGGMALGAAIWLLDPGNPDLKLSNQLASGAAWGAIAGTFYSFFVLDETARGPGISRSVGSTLDPATRITVDPIGDEEKRRNLMVSHQTTGNRERRLELPLLRMRF